MSGPPGYSIPEGLSLMLTVGEKTTTKKYGRVDQFGGETKYFSACVPDGEEGLADVRVIKAIEESLSINEQISRCFCGE